jgi:predicted acylesterase/phospholipase RssA
MIGSCFAGGAAPDEIEREIRLIRWQNDILDFRQSFWNLCRQVGQTLGAGVLPLRHGLLANSRVIRTVNRLVKGKTFSEIKPLIITGTDIGRCQRVLFSSPAIASKLLEWRREELTRRGTEPWRRLYDPEVVPIPFDDVGVAARVTSCFPGVMSSIEMELTDAEGQTATRLLNDGGIMDQIPVLPLRAVGCEKVIAIHLGFVPYNQEVNHVIGVAMNAVQGVVGAQIVRSLERADFVLYDPEIELASMHRFDHNLVEKGYTFTRLQLPAIRQALEV